MGGYGRKQATRRKEATAQLKAEETAGGGKLHKARSLMQVGSGKAYDPAARLARQKDYRTKNEQFVAALSSEKEEGRFRDRAHIAAMRSAAATRKAEMAEAIRKRQAEASKPRKDAGAAWDAKRKKR